MSQPWIARIALCLVAASALVGCGKKAAPAAAPVGIDSVFTSAPAADAGPVLAQQQQDREQQDAEHTSQHGVGGPSDDHGSSN